MLDISIVESPELDEIYPGYIHVVGRDILSSISRMTIISGVLDILTTHQGWIKRVVNDGLIEDRRKVLRIQSDFISFIHTDSAHTLCQYLRITSLLPEGLQLVCGTERSHRCDVHMSTGRKDESTLSIAVPECSDGTLPADTVDGIIEFYHETRNLYMQMYSENQMNSTKE